MRVYTQVEIPLDARGIHLTWVLGAELEFSTKAVSVLNHWAIAPAPVQDFYVETHYLSTSP